MNYSQQIQTAFILLTLIICIRGEEDNNKTSAAVNKQGKLLSLFNVVTFPNDNCNGNTRNGTCYTSDECEQLGGISDGTCSSGFGVCCVFTITCGGSSSQNCTYIIQSAFTSLSTNPCTYQLNRVSDSVCRIRLDFNTFVLAGSATVTTAEASTAVDATIIASIGDCITDRFTATSAHGNVPVICGFNTGQHIYLDTNSAGNLLNFALSTSTDTSRSWNIKATHYDCGSDQGGPRGCLQYFTETSGTVSSFNFDTTATAIGANPNVHLSNQDYEMCFRRASGMCFICYIPAIPGIAAMPDNQGSFGLSVVLGGTIATSETVCSVDYLVIPQGQTTTNAAINDNTNVLSSRFCGRFLGSDTAGIVSISICTRSRPFRLRFVSDDAELGQAIAGDATNSEIAMAPGGVIGFSLNYVQGSC